MVPRSWIIGIWIALCAATVLFLVVGIKYLIVSPEHLPSFLPGSLKHSKVFILYKSHHHHLKHPLRTKGAISLTLAVISFIAAFRLRSRLLD